MNHASPQRITQSPCPIMISPKRPFHFLPYDTRISQKFLTKLQVHLTVSICMNPYFFQFSPIFKASVCPGVLISCNPVTVFL